MMRNRKGQGSFLAGDLPAIIMIVVAVGFFLSSLYMSIEQFNSKKWDIQKHAALVEATDVFLKENAKIRPRDIESTSEFYRSRLKRIEITYGLNVYVELQALDDRSPMCTSPCSAGDPPPEGAEQLSKRFPIALKSGDTDLEVYPALVKVVVY